MKRKNVKKRDTLIAELYERKSQYGNMYFAGKFETGGKVTLRKLRKKKNAYGEQVWQLFVE